MSGEPPAPISASRFQRLVGFVRRLIDYGSALAASVRRGDISLDSANPADAAHRFGTRDLRILLARIARGLLLAEALWARLTATATGRQHRNRPAPPRPETDREPDPDNLPTAEMIAEAIRRRPVGSVLADICRDFGIIPSHPAWREMFEFLICYDGNLAPLINDFSARMHRVRVPLSLEAYKLAIKAVCTGPPWPAPDIIPLRPAGAEGTGDGGPRPSPVPA